MTLNFPVKEDCYHLFKTGTPVPDETAVSRSKNSSAFLSSVISMQYVSFIKRSTSTNTFCFLHAFPSFQTACGPQPTDIHGFIFMADKSWTIVILQHISAFHNFWPQNITTLSDSSSVHSRSTTDMLNMCHTIISKNLPHASLSKNTVTGEITSRRTTAGIATMLRTGWYGFRIPTGISAVARLRNVQNGSEARPAAYSTCTRVPYRHQRDRRRDVNHLPQSSAEVLLRTLPTCLYGGHRKIFNFFAFTILPSIWFCKNCIWLP